MKWLKGEMKRIDGNSGILHIENWITVMDPDVQNIWKLSGKGNEQ